MSDLHYYEMCFYHDEDDDMATENRCSYCIKTEIDLFSHQWRSQIDNRNVDEIALQILFGNNPTVEEKVLMENFTSIFEISEDEAFDYFDMEGLNNRIESNFGVYYSR